MENLSAAATRPGGTTAQNPYGNIIDESGVDEDDGTVLQAVLFNSLWQGCYALLNAAGLVPSGNVERIGASQVADAIKGGAEYSANVNYRTGAQVYKSGVAYRATAASGPATAAVDPATDSDFSHWEPETRYVMRLAHPVGAVLFLATGTDPNTAYGGTWVRHSEGRFPVGFNSAGGTFNTLGATGGGETHTHAVSRDGWGSDQDGDNKLAEPTTEGRIITGSGGSDSNVNLDMVGQAANDRTTGSGSSLPPYLTVAMWQRTA